MNLYSINYKLEKVLQDGFFVDEETGEFFESDDINDIEMELSEKALSVGKFIKSLRIEAEGVKKEEKALSDRRKSIESKANGLEKYLDRIIQGKVFKDSQCVVGYKAQQDELKINIPVEKLPKLFLRTKIEVIKNDLKKFVKDNPDTEYAEMVERPKKIVIK